MVTEIIVRKQAFQRNVPEDMQRHVKIINFDNRLVYETHDKSKIINKDRTDYNS